RPSHSTALPPLRVGTEGRASGARYLGWRAELVQHLRHADRAVVLLVVLHDRDDRPPHRNGGAVEGVDLLGPPAFWSIADPQPARLEVGGVRARGELAVALLPRQPRLEVVLLRGRGAEVPGRDVRYLVGDPEGLQDLLHDR